MFELLQNWLLAFVAGPGGYVGLFLSGALATTLIPLSPEVIALGAWSVGMPVVPVIVVLVVGNYAGNALNYAIAYFGRAWVMETYFPRHQHRLMRAERLFERYGPAVLLFSWLPIVGDPLTFIPGIVHYSFTKFTLYVLVSKVVLYAGLWYLAGQYVA